MGKDHLSRHKCDMEERYRETHGIDARITPASAAFALLTYAVVAAWCIRAPVAALIIACWVSIGCHRSMGTSTCTRLGRIRHCELDCHGSGCHQHGGGVRMRQHPHQSRHERDIGPLQSSSRYSSPHAGFAGMCIFYCSIVAASQLVHQSLYASAIPQRAK
jgi:hypothetical protein